MTKEVEESFEFALTEIDKVLLNFAENDLDGSSAIKAALCRLMIAAYEYAPNREAGRDLIKEAHATVTGGAD